ncbi:hypothetical protein, partial [Enterobacter kobei]|uniref:hypothetical protein n=1 Tax=Enterobacter kobei TaxID=208224 RepID=UPI00298CA920
ADRNRSHWSTSKTPSYTKSVSWHHYPQFNNAASSTVQFKINGPDSRKMITQPGTTWKGAVTLVFDADLPFASQ